ncbi:FAD-dependent oxidoreductase [Aurantimonas endophytica]|uniref:Thioredoxin reductase n=1 Tax=Aurantimonas endophytica TaxID=1522175 RepID=A0A7W6HFS6_9HYPH|nr:FAD-dependent oxidoreductase [Aurantimonas endophytica]MBB4004404.1 thioredoxin reductase [Aurantimonas endophytica]MCO6405242.1 FAD-dependent oxidoreductase [Aurantimonas endophytica]
MTRLSTTDVAIIGAGPYGLALAAHLQTRNVEYRLFGETMAAWKNNMPAGMLLKSYPWASSIPGPDAQFSLRSFCAERGYPYHDELIPLPLDRFIEYGEAFQERFVAGSCEKRTLTSLEPGADGFRVRFADGETVDARRVVIAVGLRPFRHLPEDVAQLPSQLRSHSSDYGSLEHLDGKETVVVGSGASATDLAALLHERGIRTTLVARQSRLRFASRPRPRTLVERLTAPTSGIGQGWSLAICAKYPQLIHLLSEEARFGLAYGKALGPFGSASAKERVAGVPLRLGQTICSADVRGDRVELMLADAAGQRRVLQADHVIYATGYRIDVSRLGFLSPAILNHLRLTGGAPTLTRNYETSVPGLHFVGPAAAPSFGPVCRFVYGSRYPARYLAHYLATDRKRVPRLRLPPPAKASASPEFLLERESEVLS